MQRQARGLAADIASQKGPSGLADKEIVALTAFLQRLGTDIRWKKPAVQPIDVVPAAAPAGPAAGGPVAGASRPDFAPAVAAVPAGASSR
jgi:hypothetical protein